MKILLLILILPLAACSMPKYAYEVHLVNGGGTHHLITTDTKDEAMDFIDSQKDSHGTMKIIKQRKD